MNKIFVTFENESDLEKLSKLNLNNLILLDSKSKKTKKKSFMLKSHWSASKDPFAIIVDDNDNPIKAFYSEAEDVITELIKYLKNENTSIR